MMCPLDKERDEQILLEYCSGGLDENRTAEVKAHAQECTACAAWIREQQMVWSALDDFAAPVVSPEFNARVYQRIGEQSGSFWQRIWHTAWNPVLATAAVAAALARAGEAGCVDSQDAMARASGSESDLTAAAMTPRGSLRRLPAFQRSICSNV